MSDSKTGFALTLLVAASICAARPAAAEEGVRPNLERARAVFARLPALDRNEAILELMATGDFDGMASGQLGPRLYDAVASFQAQHGLDPTGVPDRETRYALAGEGSRIFNSWGFEFLNHPDAQASVAIPTGLGFSRSPTRRGYALVDRKGTMSIDFAFLPDKEAGLDQVFANLTRTGPDRQIGFQVLRPTFLAVAGSSAGKLFYARWIVVPDGVAGFTISWNRDAYPNANRIATVMANELYPRHMLDDGGQGPALAEALPGDRDGAEAPRADRGVTSGRPPLNDGTDGISRDALERMQRDRAERDRLAAEAEAQRRRLADDETARAADLDGLAAARLKRAQAAAEKRLAEAARFVGANRDPHEVAILTAITDLRGVSSGRDPRAIESRTEALSATLNDDPVYAAYAANARAAEAREGACTLAEARRRLAVQRSFLIEASRRDPLGNDTPRFMALVRQSSDPSAAADVDHAVTIVAQIDRAITAANLQASFAVAEADAERAAPGGGEAEAACGR